MLPDGKFITVGSNYRLGAYGWMYSEGEDMTSNAGIWDSLVALNWTKNNIHLFGGDPNRITVVGESAGSGIAQHLLTAWGGEGEVPFSQVRGKNAARITLTNDRRQS
jgi:carboxylesterase type B